jgi:4-hydroxy-tetrahydrodipicolinate reductase
MKTKIMVNGLPGKVAGEVAKAILESKDFELFPYSFTGPYSASSYKIGSQNIQLIGVEEREPFIAKNKNIDFLTVDYTHPSAVNLNGDFYCQHELPFIMGTTGGERALLIKRVEASNIMAIIAPNMAKQIVAFQAMLKYTANTFPNVFKGYTLEVVESHQKTKADVSGTAKTVITYFNDMGIPFGSDQIKMIREPKKQIEFGVPKDSVQGHAWHTYTLKSADKSVLFEFTHNINGRNIYADGTLDGLRYLREKVGSGEKGKVYDMIDVLKG